MKNRTVIDQSHPATPGSADRNRNGTGGVRALADCVEDLLQRIAAECGYHECGYQ